MPAQTDDQRRLAANARMLTELGARWRADWSDFDGRSLRDQLSEVTRITGQADIEAVERGAEEFCTEQREAVDF